MFSKVLIANRGEIACRIIRTCHRLGIKTVAVYSEADESALHVRMAHEAYRIGRAPAAQSYLRADSIIKVAKKAKVDAIHPGYGFLSENPRFVQAVEEAGLTFVGPSAEVMTRMGDKVLARRLAVEADLPVVSGTAADVEDDQALESARDIGFPLLVKAAEGGGGMGIRLIEREEDLLESIGRARAQAMGAFGNSRMYLEQYVGQASHVEVQLIADHHGHVVHLGERDCSIQRRHQKIIEETPCPKLSPELREQVTQAAVRLAESIGYTNAGTVEFLVSPDGRFYFLEMNTRVQVEHPITEVVTGLDLVEIQLRVAAGEELPLTQADVRPQGHAIEARIYPEDPITMLPVAGTVSRYEEPGGPNVRVDSALYQGYQVSSHYEPLMAKVVGWGNNRQEAIAQLTRALSGFRITGATINIPGILRVLSLAPFTSATYDTAFLEQLLQAPLTASSGKEMIAVMALCLAIDQDRAAKERPSPWKLHGRRQLMVGRLNAGGM